MNTYRRSVVWLIAVVLVLAACGENPLQRAGEGSTDWIGGDTPTSTTAVPIQITTTTAPPTAVVELMAAVGLVWTNDELVTFSSDTPSGVIELAWGASTGRDAYVQAHRQTIARALPGIKVPAAVPDDIVHVTSQLVFGSTPGELSSEWLAAFGFWTVAPYSQSRVSGQSVVLHVGSSEQESGPACENLRIAASEICRDRVVAGLGEASEVVANEGVTLRWDDGAYQYQLFYRTADSLDEAALMAGSMVGLTDLEDRATLAFRGVVSRMAAASPPSE